MITRDTNSFSIIGVPARSSLPRIALAAVVGVAFVAVYGMAGGEEKVTDNTQKTDAAALATMLQSFDKVQVEEHPWGWIRWLMSAKLDPKSQMTLGVVQVNAGERNPMHIHPNCEEVLYMLSGSCEHRIGDQTVVLKRGDVLRIPTGTPHAARVVGTEPMKSIVVYSSGDRQFVLAEQQ